jgi:hypothetical protein
MGELAITANDAVSCLRPANCDGWQALVDLALLENTSLCSEPCGTLPCREHTSRHADSARRLLRRGWPESDCRRGGRAYDQL